ncbi:hypothetical protein MiSe_49080 [Microseira wollei NIES-4236]|uniref:Uncharacterized protein n=1 Tax=Microseira wollei NIES-4236 TaxID=2530354 RepID=A0AAV3XDY4_9CYAN|nr:hypothetical protein MiSe_49080 [Microseira wollei NIES-4236]
MINAICLSEISSDAVSLRNDWVRFFYYGQFNVHDINPDTENAERREKKEVIFSPAHLLTCSPDHRCLYQYQNGELPIYQRPKLSQR